LNPDRRGGKPVTNCLSCGAAFLSSLSLLAYFFLVCEEYNNDNKKLNLSVEAGSM
jgi:hypothetical protein